VGLAAVATVVVVVVVAAGSHAAGCQGAPGTKYQYQMQSIVNKRLTRETAEGSLCKYDVARV
jgi:hypothetical protein